MNATLNLIDQLKQIPDYRKGKRRRHSLWLVLMLVLLGTLCGDRGYRPLADFSQQHWQTLRELLEMPTTTRIPSYSTFRHVLQRVDFVPFVALFNTWSQTFVQLDQQTWVAADGKSIKSTLSDDSESYQNFISTVSAFTHQAWSCTAHAGDEEQTDQRDSSRAPVDCRPGRATNCLYPRCPTLPKKTVELIDQQQQHYLIALKANQQTLARTLKRLHQAGPALSEAETVETSQNRTVHRHVWVYAAPLALQQQWSGLRP